jgi:uncharacterized membrane protein
MDELTMQEIIKTSYSGSLSEMSTYISLAVQTVGIIIGGIVLWRMSTVMHKKKLAQRQRNDFFETPYSKGWKRK